MKNSAGASQLNKQIRAYAIFFILALAFSLRINHIDSPMIGVNSWRLADTAAIARNYYENGFKFLYPQIDWGGEGPGYVESEFPVMPFTVAILYKITGVNESVGRIMSVLFSIAAIYFLYLLVKKHIDEKTALWACLFFSVLPLNIFYTRTFQPEALLIMSLIAGIYFFSRWMASDKKRDFLLSAGFISLACLLDITSLYIGLPLLYIGWQKYGRILMSQRSLWLFSLIVLIPVALWYFHAHKIAVQYGNSVIREYVEGKWINLELIFSLPFWQQVLLKNLAGSFLTWGGFLVFIAGLFLKRKTPNEKTFDFWLMALLIYIIIAAKGNYMNEYSQLPIILPAVVYMGKVYARYFTKESKIAASLLLLCLVSILIFSETRYYSYIQHEDKESSAELKLAERVKELTEEGALIITADRTGDPTILYLSHRKGWRTQVSSIDDTFIGERVKKGAKYLVGNHSSFTVKDDQRNGLRLYGLLHGNYKVIFNDGKSFIVKVSDV